MRSPSSRDKSPSHQTTDSADKASERRRLLEQLKVVEDAIAAKKTKQQNKTAKKTFKR